MEPSAMELISSRLAGLEGLYFPRAFLQQEEQHQEDPSPSPSRRKSALLDLLSRDTPIFLERYGEELTAEELGAFQGMEGDYEVGWHLRRLRKAMAAPTPEERRGRVLSVKNRRRAYMEELVREGEYFSEDSMREREPYLHHEYVGRFRDPAGRGMPRPGERWSETLLRRADEAVLVGKIRGEQQRLGVDRREWVGGGEQEEEEEEEEEEDEEEEEEEDEEEEEEEEKEMETEEGEEAVRLKEVDALEKIAKNGEADDHSLPEKSGRYGEERISAAELQDQLEEFTSIMQQKFLAGEDAAYVDYTKIDNNERLDDYWVKEANHDAEERYFDED